MTLPNGLRLANTKSCACEGWDDLRYSPTLVVVSYRDNFTIHDERKCYRIDMPEGILFRGLFLLMFNMIKSRIRCRTIYEQSAGEGI